jgi:flagellar biosynthesis component FlhA
MVLNKFEQVTQMMAKMSEEERMKVVEAKKNLCICGGCPSYTQCAGEKEELLYCTLGKSPACITEEKGCICPQCPITDQMGLKHEYYCTKGSEKEQRGM